MPRSLTVKLEGDEPMIAAYGSNGADAKSTLVERLQIVFAASFLRWDDWVNMWQPKRNVGYEYEIPDACLNPPAPPVILMQRQFEGLPRSDSPSSSD